jgi:hypothetical protein
VSAVERYVRGRDHQKNVNLAFKKPDLRILTKPATNTRRTAVNINGVVQKPKH